jgi:hypothetical protein
VGLRREPGVVAKAVGRVGGIVLRFAQGFAVVEGVDARKLVVTGVDCVGHAKQQGRAIRGVHRGPRALVKGFARRRDCGFDVGLGRLGDRRNRLPVCRIVQLARCAAGGEAPLAVDVHWNDAADARQMREDLAGVVCGARGDLHETRLLFVLGRPST